jgi:hypothetical protein
MRGRSEERMPGRRRPVTSYLEHFHARKAADLDPERIQLIDTPALQAGRNGGPNDTAHDQNR